MLPTCRVQECTQRPGQPSAPRIKRFSCRHRRRIQEDFIDAGKLCLPGTSLLPAPEPSCRRLPERACGLSATENSPLLSDDACRHPGFQRGWLNCGGQPLLPGFLDSGGDGDIFSLTFRREHIHQTSVREKQATVKAMLGTCQCVPHHLWAPPQRSPAEKGSMDSTHNPTQLSALQIVFISGPESSPQWGGVGLDSSCISQL